MDGEIVQNLCAEVWQAAVSFELLSDHALIEATKQGDETAFAEIVSRYRNPITNYLYRIATNLAISEMRRRKRRKLLSLTGLFQPEPDSETQFDPADENPLPDA